MQVQRTKDQIERDERASAIFNAGINISNVQAKEIHNRHKTYAKRAKNLKSSKADDLKPAMEFEKLLLEQRLLEINEYLQRADGL